MRQCNENQLTHAAQQNADSKFTQKAAVHTLKHLKIMFSKCRQVNYSAVKMASLLEAAQLQ